jgi:hypothetical protein
MSEFHVFSGWDRRQADAAEVFAFSVRENASVDVDVRFLKLDKMPVQRTGVTEFSYSRFLVPLLCGYEGRALFADGCDMLCLGDVSELAQWDMQGKPLCVVKHEPLRRVPRHDRARSWTSLMLMDCAKLTGWGLDYVQRQSDDQLMRLRTLGDDQIGDLPGEWNDLCPVPGEPSAIAKIAHWSAISDPNIGSWINASGSLVWDEWRRRWLQDRDAAVTGHAGGRPRQVAPARA